MTDFNIKISLSDKEIIFLKTTNWDRESNLIRSTCGFPEYFSLQFKSIIVNVNSNEVTPTAVSCHN